MLAGLVPLQAIRAAFGDGASRATRHYACATRRFAPIVVALLAAVYAANAADAANPRVLVFTKTVEYRHDSIPAAIQAVRDLGAKNGFDVTATEDDTVFSAAGLAPYDAVVFLLTTGDVLNDAEQAAFETWYRAGHALRRRPLGGRHRARLALVRAPRRRLVVRTPGDPGRDDGRAHAARRVDGGTPRALDAHRRVVRLAREPAHERRARARHASTRRRTRRATGRWAPTIRSRGSTSSTAAAPGTPRTATRRSRTPIRSSSGMLLGGIRYALGGSDEPGGRSAAAHPPRRSAR